MPSMSSDQIQNVSVKVVEGFLNDKVPMSQGLAKQASEMGMNLEQIKRACEASNVISHLKLLQLSNDRTIEFPVCDVNEVMTHMCVPEGSSGFAKAASATETIISPQPAEQSTEFKSSVSDSLQYFVKAAAENERRLEDLESQSIVVTDQLLKLASELRKEATWNDKLSCVETEFHSELSTLIGGSVSDKRDFGGSIMFKQAELNKVTEIADLFKMAKCIVAEKAKRVEMKERAASFTKEAMLGTIGSAIGRGLGGVTKATAKAAFSPVKGIAEIGRNAIAKTGPGKLLNMKVKPGSSVAKGIKATAPVAGAAGFDAYMYRGAGGPGYTSSGASKDVWDSLQG